MEVIISAFDDFFNNMVWIWRQNLNAYLEKYLVSD